MFGARIPYPKLIPSLTHFMSQWQAKNLMSTSSNSTDTVSLPRRLIDKSIALFAGTAFRGLGKIRSGKFSREIKGKWEKPRGLL
jgi:hypothetical protein